METYIEKANILIEALPYIKRFRGKELLVKYGGAALSHGDVRKDILQDLVFMQYVGIRPILIHGGGIHITENLKKKKIETKFVNGLRVSDEETIKVVVETLAAINRELVSDINQFGGNAVGLSGHDSDILHVTKHVINGDVGFVGDVKEVNTKPLKQLTENGIIPVVYPLGIGPEGKTYNVNADEAASKIASAMQVQKIMVLTNVQGIMKDPEDENTLMRSLHLRDVQNLIDEKVIQGGMIPKVHACTNALRGGVQKAHVVDGRINHSLLLEVFTDRGIGTEIVI